MFTREALDRATSVVYSAMPPTPQYCWPLLSQRAGCETWVKHENHTPTGAFKVRGGLVYLDALVRRGVSVKGLISATRGNHGQSLAFAGRRHGVPVTIVAPHGNSADKNAAIRAWGATLLERGRDFDEARKAADGIAAEGDLQFVPPFHADLVCGVATYALELFSAVAKLDTVYVPIGMGSGICGLIRTRDLLGLKTSIVGVVSSGAPAFKLSVETGKVVTTPSADTLADGMACREPLEGSVAIVRAGADRVVEVSDSEVGAAMRYYYSDTHNLVEGAGAAPLAALMKERRRMQGRRVGLVVSGGNVDLPLFLQLVSSVTQE